jgi:hypothetical protein
MAAALLVVSAALMPASAGAAKTPRVKVGLGAAGQVKLLEVNRLTVRIRGPRGTRARAIVAARRPAWRKGRTVRLTPARSITLKKKPRTLRLRLRKRGRELVRGCRPLRLIATVRVIRRGKVQAVRAVAPLRLNRPGCGKPRPGPDPVAPEIDLSRADRCDFLAGGECLLPWPNDYFARPDPSSSTGLRVNLHPASTPINAAGVHVDPTDLNTSDGFSPGAMIVARVPGLDTPEAFARTGAVPVTDMARYAEPDQPVVLIDAESGRRQLIWTELDSTATTAAGRALIIRPGRNLVEGRRYIVALRSLRNANGELLGPSDAFRIYRDRLRSKQALVEERRPHMEDIFSRLARAGIERESLYLAWDFTVASTENLTGRVLRIRDDAFGLLGDENLDDGVIEGESPEFLLSEGNRGVEDFPPGSTGNGEQYARRISGWFRVPCYLNAVNCEGNARFDLGPDGLPQRIPGNWTLAPFTCAIPRTGLDEGGPDGYTVREQAQPVLHGHGLFASANQVLSEWTRRTAFENNHFTCGTDWTGLEGASQPLFEERIQDMSRFPEMVDRLQQAWVNALYLGRLMAHPDGFAAHRAFRYGGVPAFRNEGLAYWGVSNGGIMGGALSAIAPDFTRSVLAVPAMNFSTMMTRNNLWQEHLAPIFAGAYRREIDRPLLMSMMQLWWDRGEPNGYANHITRDPLPDTPVHKVLIESAFGDFQVANVATEVMARTLGLPVKRPMLDPGRSTDALPGFDLRTLGPLPGPDSSGGAMFVWDTGPKRNLSPTRMAGTMPPPVTNTAPGPEFGLDPHTEILVTSAPLRAQIGEFLRPGGTVIDPCGDGPCYAGRWTGP